MRVEKSFALPRVSGALIGVFGDVFNVTNAGAARNFVSISGPRFGLPQGWIEPRALRMGARVMF